MSITVSYYINIFQASLDTPQAMEYLEREQAIQNVIEMPREFPQWKYIHTIHVVNDQASIIDLSGDVS